jgi:hypothetical protein
LKHATNHIQQRCGALKTESELNENICN